MTDINAYSDSKKYEKFQHLRPDYLEAEKKSLELAKKYLKGKNVADFCCGIGNHTKALADLVGGLNKVCLVDINKKFLEVARFLGIKAKEIEIQNKDVLAAKLKKEYDLLLSIFAYHHMEDEKKEKYVEQAKNCLKKRGILVLAEIYFENEIECLKYYDKLFKSIPKNKVIPGLKEFLEQTARSTDFEYKVPKKFADSQFKNNGFKMLEEVKIWPLVNSLGKNQGTFVQVYELF